jgi:hypothetical protein
LPRQSAKLRGLKEGHRAEFSIFYEFNGLPDPACGNGLFDVFFYRLTNDGVTQPKPDLLILALFSILVVHQVHQSIELHFDNAAIDRRLQVLEHCLFLTYGFAHRPCQCNMIRLALERPRAAVLVVRRNRWFSSSTPVSAPGGPLNYEPSRR